jgi:hypothetical protein
MQQPGSPEARYQLVLTGSGSELFGIDGRGYVYLNVDDLDADPPRPLTYELVVGLSVRETRVHRVMYRLLRVNAILSHNAVHNQCRSVLT